jgi:hypothetical protein
VLRRRRRGRRVHLRGCHGRQRQVAAQHACGWGGIKAGDAGGDRRKVEVVVGLCGRVHVRGRARVGLAGQGDW